MALENLTLIQGASFETMISFFEQQSIYYEVATKPNKGEGYFRYSRISVQQKDSAVISSEFVKSRNRPKGGPFGTGIYIGEYNINNDFDLSTLDGLLLFHDGRLVERIDITYTANRS